MENSDSGLTLRLGLGLTKLYLNIPSVFVEDDTFRQNSEWWSAFYRNNYCTLMKIQS